MHSVVDNIFDAPFGRLNLWKKVVKALRDEEIDYRLESLWVRSQIIDFPKDVLCPMGADLIARYYERKYGIHITLSEAEKGDGGGVSIPLLSQKALGSALPPSVPFWAILLRRDPSSIHWIPLLMRRKEGKVEGIILDSIGPAGAKQTWGGALFLAERVPEVQWYNCGMARQIDNHSCGIDAFVVLKGVLRQKEDAVNALMADLISGKKEALSSIARGAQAGVEELDLERMVFQGKGKPLISLGEHFAKYRSDVVEVAECVSSMDGKPAEGEEGIFTYRSIPSANTFLWQKGLKYKARVEKYRSVLLEKTPGDKL